MGIATDMELINYWPYHSLDNFLKDFDGFQTPKERLKNKGNRRKEMERKGRKRKGLSNKTTRGVPPLNFKLKTLLTGFPGGAVVESLPANAGDTGSSPGLGRSHMPQSNWACEP